MNLVLDDAEEIHSKTKSRKQLGKFLAFLWSSRTVYLPAGLNELQLCVFKCVCAGEVVRRAGHPAPCLFFFLSLTSYLTMSFPHFFTPIALGIVNLMGRTNIGLSSKATGWGTCILRWHSWMRVLASCCWASVRQQCEFPAAGSGLAQALLLQAFEE